MMLIKVIGFKIIFDADCSWLNTGRLNIIAIESIDKYHTFQNMVCVSIKICFMGITTFKPKKRNIPKMKDRYLKRIHNLGFTIEI
jgi:hypothetical protein